MTMESQIQADRSQGNSSWNYWSNVAADQGDSSAEEVESPRSVVTAARSSGGRWRRWRKTGDRINKKSTESRSYMHSQVLRIKEEELQIGEDVVGDYYGGSTADEFTANTHPLVDTRFVIWSRSMLPASPLGASKNNRNDFNC